LKNRRESNLAVAGDSSVPGLANERPTLFYSISGQAAFHTGRERT
jgi:hypothetical protein